MIINKYELIGIIGMGVMFGQITGYGFALIYLQKNGFLK